MRFIGENGSFERHFFALEKEFEKQIYRFSKELFRDGRIVRWEPLLIDELSKEGVKPDSLLVNHDFTEWWVVEVELGRSKKFSLMVDQLNKLTKVDYTKHIHDVAKGLRKMFPEESLDFIKNKAKILCSQPPNFLLILDNEEKRMTEWAKRREWRPLVVEVWTNSQQYRLCLPNEISVTREKILVNQSRAVISVFDTAKPKIVNNYWLYKLVNHELKLDNDIIVIDDSSLSFDVEILRYENNNDIFLKLPRYQKSINEIIKGNKIGNLYHDFDNRYLLKLKWS